MRRVIQRELDDRIADLLVGSGLAAGGLVTVTADGPELVVAAGSPEVPLAA
jgi:ATP-dependent Clp protease ATP-binding subunit ClpC